MSGRKQPSRRTVTLAGAALLILCVCVCGPLAFRSLPTSLRSVAPPSTSTPTTWPATWTPTPTSLPPGSDAPRVNTSLQLPTPTETQPANAPYDDTVEYVVQRGDTLARIAAMFDTTVADLADLNKIANPNLIEVGQHLVVKVPLGWTPAPTSTPRPTATPAPQQLPTARIVMPTNTVYVAPAPTAAPRTCCKICTTGKACGNSCINRNYTCHQPPGCACNAY